MTKSRPNLLLIFTDQQRWDTLGAYGNACIQTPHLDRLAAQGAIFENAITPSPICVAARAALISGYAAGKTNCLNNHAPLIDDRDTLPAHLAALGYHTQAIGKMHFQPDGQTYGFNNLILSEEMRGTRTAESVDDVTFDDYDQFLIQHNMWGWEKPPEIGYNEIKPLINGLPKEFHVTQWCGDRTVEWLQSERPQEQPFFLFTSFVKPHVPYDCPAHLADLYDPAAVPAPSSGVPPQENPLYVTYPRAQEWDLYSDEAARRARAYYYANITFIDEQVGRIMQALRDENLEENTLVVFASDHGDMLGDHGLWFKSLGYEGSVHIPMLAAWPGVVPVGVRVTDAVSLLDIFPTFLQCADSSHDIKSPDWGRPGQSLLSLIGEDDRATREICFAEMDRPPFYKLYARHRDWKYIWFQNGGFEELYDLRNDPQEQHNLADDREYQLQKSRLRRAAIEWVKEYSDPALCIDESHDLRAAPYSEDPMAPVKMRNTNPFSRMPWESRIPPSILPEERRSWWWRVRGGDATKIIGVDPMR